MAMRGTLTFDEASLAMADAVQQNAPQVELEDPLRWRKGSDYGVAGPADILVLIAMMGKMSVLLYWRREVCR